MSPKELIRRENLPSVFNDVFRPWDSLLGWPESFATPHFRLKTIQVPSVNIREADNLYEISLAAPGLKKEDFKIDVEGDMLTISAETKDETEEKEDSYTRKEFSYNSFTRSFTLPEWVKKDSIQANYNDGLLKLTLPKMEEAKKAISKKIEVK